MKKLFFVIYIATVSIAFSCVDSRELSFGSLVSGVPQSFHGNIVRMQSDLRLVSQKINCSQLQRLTPINVLFEPIILSQHSLTIYPDLYKKFPTLVNLCKSEWKEPHAVQIFVFLSCFFGQDIVIFLAAPTELKKEDSMTPIELQRHLQNFDQRRTQINSIASPYFSMVFGRSQITAQSTFNDIYEFFLKVVPEEKREDFYRLCSSFHFQPLLCAQYLTYKYLTYNDKSNRRIDEIRDEIHSHITTALLSDPSWSETKYDDKTKFLIFHMCQSGVQEKNAKAQFNNALMYSQSCLVVGNLPKAFGLFKMAADQGHSAAQFICGKMYWEGKGVEENKDNALMYWKMAANQGHSAAQSMLWSNLWR